MVGGTKSSWRGLIVGGGRTLMVDGIATCETQCMIATVFPTQRFDLNPTLLQ